MPDQAVDPKAASAIRLAEAREAYEKALQSAARNQLSGSGKSVRFELTFEDSAELTGPALDQHAPQLEETLRGLTEQFESSDAAVNANLHVRSVTVIDSDGDGNAAVKVNYRYPDER